MNHSSNKKVSIEIFSDVLCVWAYNAQIRIEQLKQDFAGQVELHYRYIPIFAAAKSRIENGWKDKGGFAGFNQSLLKNAENWDHIEVHRKIWLQNVPESSSVPHLYLKAIQHLQQQGIISSSPQPEHNNNCLLEAFSWRMRCAFFAETRNVGEVAVLDAMANDLGIPVDAVHEAMNNGIAHAALHRDLEARDQYMIPGSPTLVFNEGRQRLYGNVGYRIIEANIRELLHNSESGEASWC